MSGFFVARKAVIAGAMPALSNIGFKVLLDLLVSSPVPLKIVELPYTFRSRNAGESKLDSSVAIDFVMLLLDKKLGRFVSPRLIMFAVVGGLGLFVHLTVLRASLAVPGVSFSLAQSIAVLTAIAFNFTLNNQLTYRDRRLRGPALFWGMLSFYAVCGLGAVANVGVGSLAFQNHSSWLVAGVAGAIVGSVWNFAASSFVTWRKR
jgi:dolichol-phosphate mannosyltransferase